ncbi:MAG: right-handed parallel beta-helix repeat-containing protein [Polyangiaceae bacterium]|jgi:hypothetical protein|nr:right-handed parallel beta-helix repeat-containing protein [Polyangiaceae bacterium]
MSSNGRPPLALALVVALAVACNGSSPHGASNTPDLPDGGARPTPTATGTPVPPQVVEGFFVSEDSDAWVAHNFKLQKAWRNVYVVGEPKLDTVKVAPPGFGPDAAAAERKVDGQFPTLQAALAKAGRGDLVLVAPGEHAGFVLRDTPGKADDGYLVIRGMGELGDAKINRLGSNPQWMVMLEGASHVVMQNLVLESTGDASASRAGVLLSGDFPRTSTMDVHVAFDRMVFKGHRVWGLHAVVANTVLVQDSIFTGSVEEHGLYVSNGSDDWVIRRNVFSDNFAAGLQINLDPIASFDALMNHPKMVGQPPPNGSRPWVEPIIVHADKVFGKSRWPDGVGLNFIIERNVSTHNGKRGGAAFNFAGLSQSLIQNNLIYDNAAGGIAMWDNANSFDYDITDRQPQSLDEWKPERYPLFGCRNNLIRFNTVMGDTPRAAIQLRNGSMGNRVYGNIANHGRGMGLEVFADSVAGSDIKGNVFGRIRMNPGADALASLAVALPPAGEAAVSADAILGEMVAASNDPWIAPKGKTMGVADKRPDYRPKAGSKLLGATVDAAAPATDFNGDKRDKATPGAFNPAP